MAVTLEAFGIDKLGAEDRAELARLLLGTLPAGPAELPDWFKAELDRRAAASDADPDGGVPWAEVKAKALARMKS